MLPVRRLALAVCVGLTFLASAPGAQAALLYCNRTHVTIEAAFGHREQGVWISEGWWQIEPGQCARVLSKPLSQRFYFYFARALAAPKPDGQMPLVWSGKYSFCTDAKAFNIEGDSDCEVRGYKTQGFEEIDVGANKRDYTLTFYDKAH